MDSNIEYISTPYFEDAKFRGYEGPGWYFWDEADGQYCYGPYDSMSQAEQRLKEYCKQI